MRTKISIEIDSDVYSAFRDALDANFVKAPMILMCAMRSYAEGRIVQSGAYLLDPGTVPREKYGVVGRPLGSGRKEKVITPIIDRTKVGARDENGDLIEWVDLDHSQRPLKEFDYPYRTHPSVDASNLLEIDWSQEEGEKRTNGSLENMLIDEYDEYRKGFTAREWQLEYWNYCRYCAKKFLTLNGMPRFRYDEMYLQKHLYRIKDEICEPYYQQMFTAGVIEGKKDEGS